MTAKDIEDNIRTKFTLLHLAPQVELMVAGGTGRFAILNRISSGSAVPSASHLHAAIRRDKIIYIRPSVKLTEVYYGAINYLKITSFRTIVCFLD